MGELGNKWRRKANIPPARACVDMGMAIGQPLHPEADNSRRYQYLGSYSH